MSIPEERYVDITRPGSTTGGVPAEIRELQRRLDAHIGKGGNAHAIATPEEAGFMSQSDKEKFDTVQRGATQNQTDEYLLSLANAAGDLPIDRVDGLQEEIDRISGDSAAQLREDLANDVAGDLGAHLIAYPSPDGEDWSVADLANPDNGAAMVARGVVAKDSIADLLSIPESIRGLGQQYLVKGFYSGSKVGGGLFFWDAEAPKGGHNGVTVLDPDKMTAWSGAPEDIANLFAPSAEGQGCYVRASGDEITPWSAGAYYSAISGDTLPDSIISLNQFNAVARTEAPLGRYILRFVGNYAVSEIYNFTGVQQAVMQFDGTIAAKGAMQCIMRIDGCVGLEMFGKLELLGLGSGGGVRDRAVINGLEFMNSSRLKLCEIRSSNLKGWAVLDREGGNNCIVGSVVGRMCGAMARGSRPWNAQITGASIEVGITDTNSQRTEIYVTGVDELPPPECQADYGKSGLSWAGFVRIGGKIHGIHSVDYENLSFRIFPRADPAIIAASTELEMVFGGALSIGGGSSAKALIDTVVGINCGIVYNPRSQSGPSVRRVLSELGGVAVALGSVGQIFSGTNIESLYTEGESFAEIIYCTGVTYTSNVSYIGCSNTVGPSAWHSLTPVTSTYITRGEMLKFPVVISTGFETWDSYSSWGTRPPSDNGQFERVMTLSKSTKEVVGFDSNRSGLRVVLRDDADYRRLKGVHVMKVVVTGTAANYAALGSIRILKDAGYTINGVDGEVLIAAPAGPVEVTAFLVAENNWVVEARQMEIAQPSMP